MVEIQHPGLLHQRLGVPQGQPIPPGKMQQGLNSPNPAERKEAQFAVNFNKPKFGSLSQGKPPAAPAAKPSVPLVGHWMQ